MHFVFVGECWKGCLDLVAPFVLTLAARVWSVHFHCGTHLCSCRLPAKVCVGSNLAVLTYCLVDGCCLPTVRFVYLCVCVHACAFAALVVFVVDPCCGRPGASHPPPRAAQHNPGRQAACFQPGRRQQEDRSRRSHQRSAALLPRQPFAARRARSSSAFGSDWRLLPACTCPSHDGSAPLFKAQSRWAARVRSAARVRPMAPAHLAARVRSKPLVCSAARVRCAPPYCAIICASCARAQPVGLTIYACSLDRPPSHDLWWGTCTAAPHPSSWYVGASLGGGLGRVWLMNWARRHAAFALGWAAQRVRRVLCERSAGQLLLHPSGAGSSIPPLRRAGSACCICGTRRRRASGGLVVWDS